MKKVRLYESFHNIDEASGDFAGWIAIDHKGTRLEIKADEAKDLWAAKKLAISKLRVPKSKEGMLAIAPAVEEAIDVNEARSIRKIQNDYDKVVQNLLDTKESWKDCKASGDAKGEAKCLADLKKLTAKKKALISELDNAIGLKDLNIELAESEGVNESLVRGFYQFSKSSQMIDDILPEGGWKIGETKYAVICHNTVQMGKNIMYLKPDNSKISQNFEAHILSIHNTEEEAFEAYKNAVKYDEGMKDSCVSYAYGTLKSKGANYPFDQIGGERYQIK